MAAPVAETRQVATLVLELGLTREGAELAPRQDLATGIKHHDKALRRLRAELNEAAGGAFESDAFVVGDLDFRYRAAGALTAILSVTTTAKRLETTTFAVGLMGLSEASRRPLATYLSEVGDQSPVEVAVKGSFVERKEPGPPTEVPPPSLTRDEQRLARRICAVAVVAVALLVTIVLV
jgi:hypothetical protein